MEAVYNGHDVFVWLPTGYGMSLCYQALPFIMDLKLGLVGSQKRSLVLVVSPLVALMRGRRRQRHKLDPAHRVASFQGLRKKFNV